MTKVISIISVLVAVLVLVSIQAPPAQAQTTDVTIRVSVAIPQTTYDALTKIARAQKKTIEDPTTGEIIQRPMYTTFEQFFGQQVGQFMQQLMERVADKPTDVAALEKQMQALQDQLAAARKVPVTVTKQ